LRAVNIPDVHHKSQQLLVQNPLIKKAETKTSTTDP